MIESNEWCTPEYIINDARKVMMRIDLDPASNDKAQETIKATHYYTERTNGLDKHWYGNVWLNPPYSFPLVSNFIDKLILQHQYAHVEQAIIITNAATDTNWWQKLVNYSGGVLICQGRIKFYNPYRNSTQNRNGQTLFYIGKNLDFFTSTFSHYGTYLQLRKQ